MTTQTAWATLRVRIAPGAIDPGQLAVSTHKLHALAAFLAETPGVSGVETRDPGTPGGYERPELIVYTTPDALDDVQQQYQRLRDNLVLDGLELDREVHQGEAWRDKWKEFYRPVVVGGGTMLIRPSWIARRPQDPQLEIVIDPGRAFGTGLHETTQLCLDAACTLASSSSPGAILDLGCGSGIVALCCARLFGSTPAIVAVDIDPEATETTEENARANALGDRLDVRCGGLETACGDHERYGLVFANIRPEVLIPAAPRLVRQLAPGGTLVLSGILQEEADNVLAAYNQAGLHLVQDDSGLGQRQAGTWCALDVRAETRR